MKGVVLGVYTKSCDAYNEVVSYTKSFKDVDSKFNGQLTDILKATGPFYSHVKQRLIWSSLLIKHECETPFDCLSIVDLGCIKAEDKPLEEMNQNMENVRCALAAGVRALHAASNFQDIYIDSCDNPQCASEAAHLVLHNFNSFKTKISKPKCQVHLYKYENMEPSCELEFERGTIIAESQNFARLLAETPANHMTPTIFSTTISQKFENYQVKVIVRDREWAESMKMGSFLSVANGSDEPPKFVELHYDGLPESKECVAFVGKGITFDSGGISLKPCLNMDKMRADMGGAACVIGTVLGAASLKLKINIKGFIPLSENLPSGKATKPGDVVFAMNGKSIQVDNTDAEGRLVLADAICYAQTFEPKAVIDIATLTGAMGIALGAGAAGVFSNDNDLWNNLQKAGYLTGDRVWRFPLFSHYTKDMTGAPLADLNNCGKSGKAGACTAAAFLKEFLKPGTKWMHMDMSCVKENKDELPYLSCGMSGRPTRTLIQFLQLLCDKP